MKFVMEPKMELNEEMTTKIKMGSTASVQQLINELKHYVETGQPMINAN